MLTRLLLLAALLVPALAPAQTQIDLSRQVKGVLPNANLTPFVQSGTGAVSRPLADCTQTGKVCDTVNVRDFGAKCDGVTNDASAIQAAANALSSGGTLELPIGTCNIGSATITLNSNTVLQGKGRGVSIVSATGGDVSQIAATSKTKVVVRDLSVAVSVPGTTAYIGGIDLSGCSYCVVERAEVSGVSWAGVLLKNTTFSTVSDVYTHDFVGTVQDSTDIGVLDNSTDNVVTGNQLLAQNYHGVLVQDTTGAASPKRNLVIGNIIRQHSAYGIAVYELGADDNYSKVIGNDIQDIQGTALGGSSGACIYVVGAGGVLVEGNTVRNCNVQTSVLSLTPAGIGVNGILSTLAKVNVVGNKIDGVTKYYGIDVETSPGGANVVGNSVRVPAANTTSRAGINFQNASHIKASGNTVEIVAGATNHVGIQVTANGQNLSDVNITGNTIQGGDFGSIRFVNVGGVTMTDVAIVGNTASGGTANNIPLRLGNVVNATVSGNVFDGSSATANINQVSSTNVVYVGNFSTTTGTINLLMTGTNTGSRWGLSNVLNAAVSNNGTGLAVERAGTIAPVSGTCAVGDRVVNQAPTGGGPRGWTCMTAGTPGTWVPDGVTPDVQDFGAKCDGSTNDLTAINNALATVKQVTFPAATCAVNGSIIVNAGNQLIGRGIGQTTIKQLGTITTSQGTLYANSGAAGSQLSGIRIADMTIDGNGAALGGFSQFQHGVSLNGVSNAVIERVQIRAFRGDGLYLGSGVNGGDERHNTNVIVRDSLIDGVDGQNRNGISIIDGDGVIVTNSRFVNISHAGMPADIDMEPDTNLFHVLRNIRITSNYFDNAGGDQGHIAVVLNAAFTTEARNFLIHGNVFNGSKGVSFITSLGDTGNSRNIVVSNNIGFGLTNPFRFISGSGSSYWRGVSVIGNVFDGSTNTGMLGFNTGDTVADAIVSGNVFRGSGAGVQHLTTRSASNIQINGNTFDGMDYGIVYGTTGTTDTNVSITNNVFMNQAIKSVFDGGGTHSPATNTFLGNTIYNTVEHSFPAFRTDMTGTIQNGVSATTFNCATLPDSFPAGLSMSMINGDTTCASGTGGNQGTLITYRATISSGAEKYTYQRYYHANNTLELGCFFGRHRTNGANTWTAFRSFCQAFIQPTYGASVTIDASLGDTFQIGATNNSAFTVTNPTNGITGMKIRIRIRNSSGGALGVATWDTNYRLGAAWTQPGNGFSRSIDFEYNGSVWVEANRSAADVSN